MHKFRAEHWIVVHGKALVEINGKEIILESNESTFIPKCSKHRLSNPSKSILTLIEVQNGDYLGEDDIIRFEDIYGRINKYQQNYLMTSIHCQYFLIQQSAYTSLH